MSGDDAALPWGFSLRRDGDKLRITWRWLSYKSVLAVTGALIWNFYAAQMWSAPNDFIRGTPPLPFAISLTAVGLILAYAAVATIVNRSHVVVDRQRLEIEHGPLPWSSPPPIEVSELDQLFVKCSRSDLESGPSTYSLHALLRGGEDKRLVANLLHRSQAEHLEREIENLLRIRDRPIRVTRR